MTMRLLPLLALVLTSASSFGQGRKVAFRTLCLEHSGDLIELALPAGKPGEAAVAVPLLTGSPSNVIEAVFPGDDAVLYVKGAADKPVIAAKAPLAKSQRQLFILMPTPEGAGAGKPAYQMKAFDDDLTTFKLGFVEAINLSPVPVRFVVSGATTPQIPAGKHAIFPQSTKVDEYNMYPVSAEFLSGNGSWISGYSAGWKASNLRREIVVMLVDSRTKQPAVKFFSDTPQFAEPAPTP